MPDPEDLSMDLGRLLAIKCGMRGTATIRSVDVIKNWLSYSSSCDSLGSVKEGRDHEITEVGA